MTDLAKVPCRDLIADLDRWAENEDREPTDWEIDFLDSIRENYHLTERQTAKLVEIYEKAEEGG